MGVYDQELDNIVRWDGKRHPFYEEFFIRLNLKSRPYSLWLRYTLFAPRKELGPPTAGLWAIFFDHESPEKNAAAKQIVSIDQTVIERDIFYFQIREAAIYNSGARGQVSSGGHEISWDLQYLPNPSSFRLYPYSFYYLGFPKTKLISPNWSIRAEGRMSVDGESFEFRDAPGCQAHLWGSKRVEHWAWAHCNTFLEDPGAVLEILTTQFPIGKKMLRPVTLICLSLGDGRQIKLNRMIHWFLNKSRYDLAGWEAEGERGHWRVQVRVNSSPEAMVGVTYNDTDGSKLYCYHAEAAGFTVELFEQRGGAYKKVKTLTSPRAGAFEVAERTPVPDLQLHL